MQLSHLLRARNVYLVVIHLVVAFLAIDVLILTDQNDRLKNPARGVKIDPLKIGDSVTLSDLQPLVAGMVLDTSRRQLVFIFTTSCPFCQESVPAWRNLDSLIKATRVNLSVFGICLNSKEQALEYSIRNCLDFPIYVPNNIKEFKTRNRISGVPETIIRKREGIAQDIWIGLLSDTVYTGVANAIAGNKLFH